MTEDLRGTPLLKRPIGAITDEQLKLLKKADALQKIRLPKTWTSDKLLSTEFPPIKWVVPGIIPEGLTMLVGASKIGKSWLSLQLSVALSVGGFALGKIKVPETEVLMLALEDTPRRAKSRMDKLEVLPSKKLHIAMEWPKLPSMIEHLEAWLFEHPETSVVFVDTLQKVRGNYEQNYATDYREVGELKKFADTYGVSVVVLHHTRKMADGDYLNMVTGSVGIVGAADTIVVLSRSRGQTDATLRATGRDIYEQ